MAQTLLLSVQDASIAFGEKVLFDRLSFSICERDRICLIGRNGAGKSTLMNVIKGTRELDGGVRWQLQGAVIGYLQQDVPFKSGQTVHDYVFEELQVKEETETYKIERVIEPLHLSVSDRMEDLSGGQLRRAALARALVEEPDILLLDEPTNHLDLDVIEWLEGYLKSYRGAFMCISHDKAFLEAISDKVFWLDRGKLRVCPKGFSFFDEWATMVLEQEEREVHNRKKKLEQELDWASHGVKARRKRNVRRLDLMKSERAKLRADKNALQKMLAKIQTPEQEDQEISTRIAIDFHNVSKSFGEKVLLQNFYLRIQRGDRIGIIGRNGAGKTTFLKLLVGELSPDQGKVKVAKDLLLSYFDQVRKEMKPTASLRDVLCPHGSDYVNVMGKPRHVCGYLRDFLFDPKHVNDPVATLSGGQKNRLMLARVLANPGSLLVLDEPTNDLDMDTLDRLEDILSAYQGTLILVSHDRDFLEQTVTKIVAFEGDGKVDVVIGGYKDYVERRDKRLAEEEGREKKALRKEQAGSSKGREAEIPAKREARQMSYKQRYEYEGLPARISGLESEIATLEAALSDPDLYAHDAEAFQKKSLRIGQARDELTKAEERWLELDEIAAAFEGR